MEFLRRYSIRTKLIMIMLAAGFPFMLAVAYHVHSEFKDEYDEAKHSALVTVQAIAYQHASQVEGIRNLLISLANSPQIRNKDATACTAIVRNILHQSPSSLNIGVADPAGNLIATGVPGRFTIGDRKYFRDALATKRFSAGEYSISRALGKPAFHFGLPVLDETGRPRVVLYATYDLNHFNPTVDALKLPEGAILSMIDHKGVLVHQYPRHQQLGQLVDSSIRKDLFGAQDEGVFLAKPPEGERLLAFKRLRLAGDSSPYLYITASIPRHVAEAGANRYLVAAVTLFFAASIFTLAATRLLANRYLIAPIEQLAGAAQAVTDGRLDIRTGHRYSGDEIGRLARSFDAMAATLDVQLRKRDLAEASLKASEDKLQTIFDHMNDAMLIHDLETKRIIDANQAMCTMYGYSREEVCQLDIATLSEDIPPYSKKEALEWIAQAISGQPQIFEWRGRHCDGRLFWVEISMRLATIAGVERLIVLIRDIGERKAAEEERKELTEQLHQAQRLESIGRLAAGIAHDFNNLLTPIIGYSELISRDIPENPATASRVERIMQAASRARQLTQQLLSFGRKQILDMRTIDLNQLISAFFDIFKKTIREDIEIRLILSPELKAICADKTQIEQVLMNLVINAQDAISGIGTITVETGVVTLDEAYAREHAEIKPGTYTMLSITDTGCGMDSATARQAFEPFFTTKAVGKGSGLGLATVYGIVKQHGGSIWVYSEKGQGTIFKLFFPSVVGKAEAEEQRPEHVQTLEKGEGTILLVEDNAIVREMLHDLLVNRGYTVIEAENPLKALDLAHGLSLNLVVTDVVMPEMNGPELYKRLARQQPGLKVIFMSGYTDKVIKEHAELDHDAIFIQKPFTIAGIETKIAGMLPGPTS